MLVYHPRNDTYNCIFRLLSILGNLETPTVDFVKLKIIDFYYVFPHLVAEISFPQRNAYSHLKKEARALCCPFEKLPDNKRLFSELGDFQIQALHILKAKRILTEENGFIGKGENFDSPSIQSLLSKNSSLAEDFYHDTANFLNSIELLGDSGLKRRTGLLEYRYDRI